MFMIYEYNHSIPHEQLCIAPEIFLYSRGQKWFVNFISEPEILMFIFLCFLLFLCWKFRSPKPISAPPPHFDIRGNVRLKTSTNSDKHIVRNIYELITETVDLKLDMRGRWKISNTNLNKSRNQIFSRAFWFAKTISVSLTSTIRSYIE